MFMCMGRRVRLAWLLGWVAFSTASAEDYYWQLHHRMGLSSHDNYSLNDEERQVQVASDDAGITWGWQSDRSQLNLAVQNHFRRYAGDADDLKTSQSPELGLDWSHKPDARSDVGLSLDYLKDRTSADEYLFNEQVQTFSLSKLDVDKERERMGAALNASVMQSERWQWFGRFEATDLQYRQARDTQLLSYLDTSWSGGAFWLLQEQWDVYWQGAYSTYLPRPGDTEIQQFNPTRTRTKSLSLGVRARFDAGATLNLSLGSRRTAMDHLINHRFDKGRGTVATLEYARPFSAGSWQLSGSRALQPDSAGEIVEQDNFSASLRYNQTERLYHDLSWSWSRQQTPALENQAAEGELNRVWAWQASYRVNAEHTAGFGLQHQQINRPVQQQGTQRDEGNRVELNWRWSGMQNWY
jgi:hypothetical protein